MIYKHNKRNWKYRVLAMTRGYHYRLCMFTVPAPLFDVPTGAPDDDLIGAISVGTLIYDDPSNVEECANGGMDSTMQSDLTLCPICHKCLRWEDEFGAGTCCTCDTDGAMAVYA